MNQIKPKKNKNKKALVYTVQTLSKTLKKMETHLSLLTPPAQLPRATPRLYPVARALPCPTARAAPLPSRSHHALPSRSHRALPRLAAATTCSCLCHIARTVALQALVAAATFSCLAKSLGFGCCVPLSVRPSHEGKL
jgi:hypothetical protein